LAIDAEEGKRDAAEDRADIDDQSPALPAHPDQHRAGRAQQADDVGVEDDLGLIRRERLGDAGRRDAGVVDEHVDALRAFERLLHATLDRGVVADVDLDHLDALLAERLRVVSVLSSRIAHRGEHHMAPAGHGLRGVAAEARAGARDQYRLGHG
jgi:hypothetical protein